MRALDELIRRAENTSDDMIRLGAMVLKEHNFGSKEVKEGDLILTPTGESVLTTPKESFVASIVNGNDSEKSKAENRALDLIGAIGTYYAGLEGRIEAITIKDIDKEKVKDALGSSCELVGAVRLDLSLLG